jgi:hypothetical protein
MRYRPVKTRTYFVHHVPFRTGTAAMFDTSERLNPNAREQRTVPMVFKWTSSYQTLDQVVSALIDSFERLLGI